MKELIKLFLGIFSGAIAGLGFVINPLIFVYAYSINGKSWNHAIAITLIALLIEIVAFLVYSYINNKS